MKKKSKTIIFFGTEDFSLITLKALVEAGFNIGAVVTKPDARQVYEIRWQSEKDNKEHIVKSLYGW